MKKVLITGAGSYIGTSFERWIASNSTTIVTETLSMRGDGWRQKDFRGYDSVFHVAGIAHADITKVSEEQKALYYQVNTNLAVETAEKAKASGVGQFIYMSSLLVYGGCREKIVTRRTEPCPQNFYGDSKWQADQKIRGLEDEHFRVVILRPPMIYGRGSKGNYPQLARLAGKLPLFPRFQNTRSMLYIDNLCRFVELMIENEESGVFFPQNAEYTVTSDMVEMIAKVKGHRIVMLSGFGWAVKLIMKLPGKIGSMAVKAFGDMAYEKGMSSYKTDYAIYSLPESILLTEGVEGDTENLKNWEIEHERDNMDY